MTSSWFIFQLLTIFFYKNLHLFSEETAEDDQTSRAVVHQRNSHHDDNERQPLLDNSGLKPSSVDLNNNSEKNDGKKSESIIRMYLNEYIREEIVAVLTATLVVFIVQTCLEVRSSATSVLLFSTQID